MNLLELSLASVRAELRRRPYPSKREYEREVLQSIRRFRGKPIFDGYRVE